MQTVFSIVFIKSQDYLVIKFQYMYYNYCGVYIIFFTLHKLVYHITCINITEVQLPKDD